jgi:hypothetical protein
VTRTKYQLRRNKVRLHNQLEALLEEAHIKLSSLVSDLLGPSARRMLQALAEGETDPAALAALADQRLRATSAQLRDALGACKELNPVYRRAGEDGGRGVAMDRAADGPTGPVCYASIRMQSSGSPKSLVSGWIRCNRSLPKWVPRQRPSLPPRISPRGWGHARERKRARK